MVRSHLVRTLFASHHVRGPPGPPCMSLKWYVNTRARAVLIALKHSPTTDSAASWYCTFHDRLFNEPVPFVSNLCPRLVVRAGLTYSYRSHKPVKLVPYSQLTKTEYQAQYNRTAAAAEHPRWVRR